MLIELTYYLFRNDPHLITSLFRNTIIQSLFYLKAKSYPLWEKFYKSYLVFIWSIKEVKSGIHLPIIPIYYLKLVVLLIILFINCISIFCCCGSTCSHSLLNPNTSLIWLFILEVFMLANTILLIINFSNLFNFHHHQGQKYITKSSSKILISIAIAQFC